LTAQGDVETAGGREIRAVTCRLRHIGLGFAVHTRNPSPRAAFAGGRLKPFQEFVMQMIEAVIKPHKLDAVKTALAKLGILGVTAVECKGFGRQMGHTERYRGAKMDVGFVPKVLLKICVKSDETARAVTEIMEAARTGEVGDGKIFVYPVTEVVRIRTGERNEQAL
jgi:nitrogen regulatory protein PII